MPGHVALVGAGPGDPGLLTRHAIARLRSADLVLYDALVDPRVLRFARRAQKFFVGKRAGCHALTQIEINALLVRAARRGRQVVRLKGGDPFVFGRGGEEALALRHAGIPFEVVPGVTSAVAAPALAGIPVTHRGLSSAFLVVSGHDGATFATAIQGLTPNAVTIVVLMGLGRSEPIAWDLIDRGWVRSTPVAIVVDASSRTQQVWRGTLDDLAADRTTIDGAGPGTIVIGAVAALELATCDVRGARCEVRGAGCGVRRAKRGPARIREAESLRSRLSDSERAARERDVGREDMRSRESTLEAERQRACGARAGRGPRGHAKPRVYARG